MWKYIPFTFKNSLRNKRRTILTIASISVSLFLLGMLVAVYHAFYYREAPPEQALRLVVRNRVSLTFPLLNTMSSASGRFRGYVKFVLFPGLEEFTSTDVPNIFLSGSATM